MAGEDPLVVEAAEIARLLRELRRCVEQPAEADQRQSGLTVPQMATLEVLFDRGPLSLTELSRELGLSHSTVSGIVDRLERQGLARRSVDADDRRVTRVRVTEHVDAYARQGYVERQVGRLLPALSTASPAQRRSIRRSLALLRSLLARSGVDI